MIKSGVAIQAKKVSKSYWLGGNEIHAVREVTLSVDAGDFLAICGSSGSGKTTLLNLFGCLAAPTSGEILIGNRNVSILTDNELAQFRSQSLGFIFQNFNLLPVLSALENVEYALLDRPMPAAERRERALKTLKEVGLDNRAANRPDQLSGGQRQRVAIARAFVREPQLIIADEPTANLDRHTALEILDLMAHLNSATGSSVIMATHDPVAISKARRRVDIVDGVLK